MQNPSDTLETLASFARDDEIAAALAAASDALSDGPCAGGPGETVCNLLVALAYLTRAAETYTARGLLPELETVYLRTRRCLSDWRLAAGCEDWPAADWSRAEVVACLDAEEALAGLRARILDLAAGLDGAVYQRLARAA